MRIADYLSDLQVPFESLPHAPAYSAQKLAKYLGVPGGAVAKAVLLRGPNGLLLAVLPAARQIDFAALARQLEGPVRLASAAELTDVFRDCEWGAVSPFGHLYGLPTLLDASFSPEMWIVVEAGSHVEAVRLSCRDYERIAGPRRLAFAQR